MSDSDATAANLAAEKHLQSSLLRIAIICASSIQSLREPVQPTILAADDDDAASSSSSKPPAAHTLAAQIVSDLSQLLTLVQKHSTNLALALKPSAKAAPPAPHATVSPVSGLDAKSLEAAQAQIVALGNDLLPKIVFLAKKAWKDREVFQHRPNHLKNDPAQLEERRKLEQLAKDMGGQLMSADQLGIPPSERNDLEKKIEYSLGNSFAREIRSAVEDVLGSIADLLHSLLDDRASKALETASNARDRADGILASVGKKLDNLSLSSGPRDPAELRKRTLAANNLVWETCAKYIGERNADGTPRTITSVAPNGVRTKVHVKGLSKSNLEASKRSWNNRIELMRDGLDELKQGIDAENDPRAADLAADDADEFAFPAATPLSPQQKDRLRQISNLVKIGNLAHENILKQLVKAQPATAATIDLDEVEEIGKQLEESQDELVAACLYGEVDAGLEAQMFDHDADDADDHPNGNGNASANDDGDADLTEEQAIEKAILRTLEQYIQAIVSLSAYVTDRDELVDKVHLACATDETGDFAHVFAAKFNQLSKVLSEASSDIVIRAPSATAPAGKATLQHTPIRQPNDEFKTQVFIQELESIAAKIGSGAKITDRAIAEHLDSADPLRPMRDGYILPTFKDVCSPDYPSTSADTAPDAESLYMCGNSLGPLSRLTKRYLEQEIDAWGRKAVLGHFEHPYGTPWTQMEKRVGELCANIVGAKQQEVVVMATLTGNLHSLLASFYRPATMPFGVDFNGDVAAAKSQGRKTRHKIIFEQKAFPSDQYALASVVELNGFDPATSLVPLVPKQGTKTLDTADILATIEKCGKEGETAIVLIGGIQYFTGQLFELEKLAAKAHEYGILFGVDLAHAFANVPLALHDWGIDFACWCTYKYGSSGPGGIAGLFVHERWHERHLARQAGWWGHEKETRFSMPDRFVPTRGAEGWQVSNPSMLDMAALKGSLETLLKAAEYGERNARDEGAGQGKVGRGSVMPILRSKSLRLTAYLEALLLEPGFFPDGFDIRVVTPRDPLQRGSQLCIQIPDPPAAVAKREAEEKAQREQAQSAKSSGKEVPPPIDGKRLIARAHRRAEKQRGLVADIRAPDMLRLAPLAQFSTFTDVWRTADVLRQSLLDEVQADQKA